MSGPSMIPLGYMLKTVTAPAPDWMDAPYVTAVHSMSDCVSSDFGDYVSLWQHNGWWLYDTPDKAWSAAAFLGKQGDPLELFFYEAFCEQFDDETRSWMPFSSEDFPTDVVPPATSTLSGYDVVTFFAGTSPECSPLSCNGLASTVSVNQRCLFDNFDDARNALECGVFRNTEPGPYRIIAVRLVENILREL